MFESMKTAIAMRDMAAICLYAQRCSIKFSSMKIFRCMDGSRTWTFLPDGGASANFTESREIVGADWLFKPSHFLLGKPVCEAKGLRDCVCSVGVHK